MLLPAPSVGIKRLSCGVPRRLLKLPAETREEVWLAYYPAAAWFKQDVGDGQTRHEVGKYISERYSRSILRVEKLGAIERMDSFIRSNHCRGIPAVSRE